MDIAIHHDVTNEDNFAFLSGLQLVFEIIEVFVYSLFFIGHTHIEPSHVFLRDHSLDIIA